MDVSDVKVLKVYPAGDQKVVHVPNGRGEELRLHLEAHGIHSQVSPPAATPYERLEVEGDVDAVTLQALVDKWER